MLREIIGEVDIAFRPLDFVLALADLIFDPVKSHIHGFGSFDFYCVVGKSLCRRVVRDDACGSCLGMPEFGEDVSDVRPFLAVDEQCTGFCFGC